jgi:hypothetical protein
MEKQGKISPRKDADWGARIAPFENRLAPQVLQSWRSLTRLRNDDTHEEPVVPDAIRRPGCWSQSYWSSSFFPRGWFGPMDSFQATDPKTAQSLDVFVLCPNGVEGLRLLIGQYRNL